tara:strand:+ start:768 stop:1043 length:276 start_codon:yes stop_codon:yes gene_type:complete
MLSEKFFLLIGLVSFSFCFTAPSRINAEELYREYTSPSGRYSDYSDSSGGSYTLDRGMSGSMNTLEGTDGNGNRVYKECYKSYGGTYMECY